MKTIIMLTALILTGCATPQVIREPYPVPVLFVPAPPPIERPVIDVDEVVVADLDAMTPSQRGQIVKSYVLSAQSWRAYAEELEEIVDKYRELSTRSAKTQLDIEAEVIKSRIPELNSD